MGKYRVEIKETALKQLKLHYKSGDKKSIKTIEKILLELSETPFIRVGKPEPLKYEMTGFWSRQINKKDRMIYFLEETKITIFIVSAMGHYTDK